MTMSAQIVTFAKPLYDFNLQVRASLKIGSNGTFSKLTGSPAPNIFFENTVTIRARSLDEAMARLEEILSQCYGDILEGFVIYEDD